MINIKYLDKILDLLPAPNAVLLADAPKFTFLQVNEGYMKITGRTREQLVGKGYFEVFPENLETGLPALQNVINNKANYNSPTTRYEIKMPDTGRVEVKYLDILNIPVLNNADEVEYIIRSVTDATEIIATQLKEEIASTNLINSEKLLNETERIARSGSWEIDLKNNTIIWSASLRKIFEVDENYKPSLESAINFFKQGTDRDKIAMVVEDAIENGSYFDVELKIITAKSNERWVRSSGEAEMEDGICNRIFGTIQDITEKKITEQALIQSRNQFQSLIQTVDGIVWEADALTFNFTFISNQVKNILGYTPEEWLNEPHFWENHIHPDDRYFALNYCQVQTRESRNHTFDYRMIKADGSLIWIKDAVSVINKDGQPKWLRGLMLDITETKRFADIDHLEKIVLELNAQKDVPIQKVLSVYLEGIETIFPHLHCSIHKVKNNRLQNWASPSLPEAYTNTIENLTIGNNTGSCGTAAFLKEKVIVSNIATDPRWANHKHLALPYNLQACWSHPIIDSGGEVMAVFGIYYNVEKLPQEEELKTVERCVAILKVIIENRQKSDIIEENSLLMIQGQELANFGNWRWDIQENIVRWSDSLFNIYGLDKASFKATFEGYQELLHPDDREMVYRIIQNVLETKKDVVFEEKIIRPGGEIRYLKSWGKLNTDEKGVPVEMIGACLDITENKLAETKLKELHKELEEHLNVLALSEKNYSDLFHLSPQPMWVFDLDSLKFLNVNSAAIQHYGYSLEEFLSMTIKEIRPKEELDKMYNAIQDSLKPGRENHAGVYKHIKKNGELIQIQAQSRFIQFNGKKCRLVLAHDITEQQNYVDAIEKRNKQLQEIAWIQSHVVRAPLARIMGLIELFKNYKSADIDKPGLLDNILLSANELDAIIKDISSKTEEVWSNNSSIPSEGN